MSFLVRGLLLAWLAWGAIVTQQQVPVWRSDLTVWTHAVALAPWLPRAHINLGKALIASGDRTRGFEVARTGYGMERQRQDATLADRARAR